MWSKVRLNRHFRKLTNHHMQAWKRADMDLKCVICKYGGQALEYDHMPPINDIIRRYVAESGLDLERTNIDTIKIHDRPFMDLYRKMAGYRWLCYDCHKEITRKKVPPLLLTFGWDRSDVERWDGKTYEEFPRRRPCGCGPRDLGLSCVVCLAT